MRCLLGMGFGIDISILRGCIKVRVQLDDKAESYKIDTARLR